MIDQMIQNAPIDTIGPIAATKPPTPPEPAPVMRMPKMEFKMGIFDPAIANSAQSMFALKKQANLPQGATGVGMNAPGFESGSTPRGGRPGGGPK